MSHNYKNTDTKIVSAVTQGKVIPSPIYIPRIDTSVTSLLQQNPWQSPTAVYSGDITDMSYHSKQAQHAELLYQRNLSEELNNSLPDDIRQPLT